MVKVEYALIKFEHRTEILVSLSLHRKNQVLALFSTQQQSVFFKDAFMNAGYTSIDTQTFEEYTKSNQANKQQKKYTCIVVMDIPARIETLSELIQQAGAEKSEILILIGKQEKKYVNFMAKKIEGCTLSQMEYSTKKFTDFNYKLKQLVQKSFDLNRQAFYAYGSFLNNFRQSLLKTIFKTEAIDVHSLAKSFGFEVAPRVKQGKFCNEEMRMKLKAQKRASKNQKKKGKKAEKRRQIQEQLKSKAKAKKGAKQGKLINAQTKVVKTKKIKKA